MTHVAQLLHESVVHFLTHWRSFSLTEKKKDPHTIYFDHDFPHPKSSQIVSYLISYPHSFMVFSLSA